MPHQPNASCGVAGPESGSHAANIGTVGQNIGKVLNQGTADLFM
jgi:hypothetical protein